MILLFVACFRPSPMPVTVEEAFDVPPPPGQLTFDVMGSHPHPMTLGQSITFSREGLVLGTGEVVDHIDQPSKLTVYVDEAVAPLLEAGPLGIL